MQTGSVFQPKKKKTIKGMVNGNFIEPPMLGPVKQLETWPFSTFGQRCRGNKRSSSVVAVGHVEEELLSNECLGTQAKESTL
jgi:hypothetical protein